MLPNKKAMEAGRSGGPSAAEVDKYLEKYCKEVEIYAKVVKEFVLASL
jgi:hypothetical protein